jgi:hypothetical protein
MTCKPLGHRAYGSIGHLPGSRLGPGDHHVPEGQADICTKRSRVGDTIFVEEKLDGSCCAVAKINGNVVALTRAGYPAITSPYEQHWLFAAWVLDNQQAFDWMLDEGERCVGEWIAQAHGTIYEDVSCPFWPFDIFDCENHRVCREQFRDLILREFLPSLISVHEGGAISIAAAWHVLNAGNRFPYADSPEGLVYRVERKGRVEFLAKWVHPQKRDGAYLPEVSGCRAVWNWGPRST